MILHGVLGMVAIPLAAWAMAGRKSRLDAATALRAAAAGIGLQAGIALILLKVPQARIVFDGAAGVVGSLQRATEAGTQLVFGYLSGAPAPFDVTHPESQFVLAFRGLPLILVVSALTRLLYHWGILQRVVAVFAALFRRVLGVGGPLGTVASANVFLGMVEAPLLIRPYLAAMGRGTLLATMAVGMATIAGTVMALYAAILGPVLPGAPGHLLTASLMNVPAALLLSRLACPVGFGGEATDQGDGAQAQPGVASRSSIDAIVTGTMDGVRLLVAVAAMLVVATALVALANMLLSAAVSPFGLKLTIEQLMGWAAAPVAFLIGIPWAEAPAAGALIAKKFVLNEFVAYLDLARLPAEALTPRSRLVLAYALCGFANLGSLGIMVGGLTAMAPDRRDDIVSLGGLAALVGLMTTLLSGAVVGTIAGF